VGTDEIARRCNQWQPIDIKEEDMPVDPTDPSKRRMPMMTDADMAMKMDPIYNAICEKFMADPDYFADTFARAWFKLTHRDMGPKAATRPGRAGGRPDLAGPDPGRPTGYDVAARQGEDRGKRPVVADMVATAWDSARTFRGRTCAAAPMARASASPRRRTGKATSPASGQGAGVLEPIAAKPAQVLADVIVLAGNVGVEQAAKAAGFDVDGAVHAGPRRRDRRDDRRRQLRRAGAARRRLPQLAEEGLRRRRGELMLDRAQLMGLTGRK
jgi:catalase-peroxidase